MAITKILTHKHPDLDAILSVFFLREHGEEKFPGVKDAELDFTSANATGKEPSYEELEKQGILTVDTGGGRFDNHPNLKSKNEEKWDTCASELVAVELGVKDNPAYKYILPFTVAQDTEGRSLSSKNAAHHLLAPHGLLEGLHRHVNDDKKVIEEFLLLLKGLTHAATIDEPSFREMGQLLDKAIYQYLVNDYKSLTDHERKSDVSWQELGQSHIYAQSENLSYKRELEKVLRVASDLLSGDKNAMPDEKSERYLLLPMALYGLAQLHGEDSETYAHTSNVFMASAVQREADWFNAIDDVNRSAKVLRGRGAGVVAIASKNGLAIKAARYRKGLNAVLYFDPANGFVTIQAGRRPDGKPILNLQRLAARLRTAEMFKRGQKQKPVKNAESVGLVADWFLHQSLHLLNRGSMKAPEIEPTVLTYKELIDLVLSEIRPDNKLPEPWCPPEDCTEKECPFFSIRLGNCYSHRQGLRDKPKKGTLGDLFSEKLKNK